MVKKSKKSIAKKLTGKKEPKKEAAAITKDMLIGEIASTYPEVVEVMFKHGMHCIGCGMTAYETIEQGCLAHGLSQEQIDKMIEEMNRILK